MSTPETDAQRGTVIRRDDMELITKSDRFPERIRRLERALASGAYDGGGTTPPPTPAPGSYTHIQATPAATWNVSHGLGYYPNVAPVDSTNREFLADVTYVDVNNLVITLTAATAGKAYLS